MYRNKIKKAEWKNLFSFIYFQNFVVYIFILGIIISQYVHF